VRKLTYYVAATLDGFIAGPDGEFEFFTFEGDLAEWILAEYPETMPAQARGPLGLGDVPNKQFDTVLMGRRTYEPALAIGVTSPYSHLRQYVFSRTLTSTDPDVEIVAGDPTELVRDLKRQDRAGIWLSGGGQLASQLLHEIDELVIKRNPIVVGSGVPLFDGPFNPVGFELVSSRRFDTGVVIATYRKP
jgi:dihydrofolate reductase